MTINKNKIKLGDLLVKAKVITEDQLKQALTIQTEKGGKLGSVIINMGFITEELLLDTLATQLNLPFLDLNQYSVDADIVRKIPERIARRFRVIAIDLKDNKYIVGMVEPTDVLALDQITKILGNAVQVVLVKTQNKVWAAINERKLK